MDTRRGFFAKILGLFSVYLFGRHVDPTPEPPAVYTMGVDIGTENPAVCVTVLEVRHSDYVDMHDAVWVPYVPNKLSYRKYMQYRITTPNVWTIPNYEQFLSTAGGRKS